MAGRSIFIIPYVSILTAINSDEKNKAEPMLISLPIDRSLIVRARYVSVFIYAAIGTIEYVLMEAAFDMLKISIELKPITFDILSISILGLAICYGILFPITYKFGYGAGRIINFIMVFIIFFGINSAIGAAKKYTASKSIMDFSNSLSRGDIVTGVLILALVIYTLSYFFSVKLYRSREF
ncbi:MAG: ABC-2 transporter permease [Clostridiales bacterium]|nr:ABC-2 transporter permease [Clostridiales bacterium]